MNDPTQAISILILLVGCLIVLAIVIKAVFEWLGMPPLVGFLALGFALRVFNDQAQFLNNHGEQTIEFLSMLGVIVLLFRVGLKSDFNGMLRQLRAASLIWMGNVTVSAGLGYIAARYLLSLELIPSLIVATAMTATSVGIPAQVWRDAKALDTENGNRFLDVAELDDISGIAFMGLLFALIPVLRSPGESNLFAVVGATTGLFLIKLVAFAAFCMLFSRYAEKRLGHVVRRVQSEPEPMLGLAGIGFIVAALAALLGFSVAIGAFFAGLLFSRDPQAVHEDARFSSLYELFSPFFFIGIGFHIAPQSLFGTATLGLVLLLAAVGGKLIGTIGPAWPYTGWAGAAALGVSMIPRAEISMLIMHRGSTLGDWAVSPSLYSAMVLVSAVTCLAAPVVLRPMLQRPDVRGGES